MDESQLINAILFSEADKSSLDNFSKDATAIMGVIENRLKNKERWGYESRAEVVTDSSQFSGFGTNEFLKAMSGQVTKEEEQFLKKAAQIRKGYETGMITDPTDGADHYYNPKLANPSWGKMTDESKVKTGESYYPEVYNSGSHSFRKETRKLGGSEKRVAEYQKALRSKGFDIEVDGIAGQQTIQAVMEFQRSAGLKADGIVGKKTLAALNGE